MTTSAVGMSYRAFARRLGVSDKAIRKGVAAGRLAGAVGQTSDGAPCITDPDLAEQLWAATTRTGVGGSRTTGAGSAESAGSAARVASSAQPATRSAAPASRRQASNLVSLVDAQRNATEERARKLRLENDAREGRLVSIDKVRREVFEGSRAVRDALLNIPDRLAGELAAETDPAVVWRKLDAAIRQGLNSAADTLAATVH